MAGKRHTDLSRKKMSATRSRKFETGELVIDRSKWSSVAKEVWKRVGHRERMSDIRKKWIRKNGYLPQKSGVETVFEELMGQTGLVLFPQYHLDGKFFDFWIEETNILIEVDGDFYHCNPNSRHKIPLYDVQRKNIENDKVKLEVAERNGYRLIRFWESDIINNPQLVIETTLSTVNGV